MILSLQDIRCIQSQWPSNSWVHGFVSNVIETMEMHQHEKVVMNNLMGRMQVQINDQLLELRQLRPRPAKFRVGQVLIKLDNNAFTVRRIDKLYDGKYVYTNSRADSPLSSSFVPEVDLRELNNTELGKY